MRFQSLLQVSALRSPITKATIWRVRRQRTIQIQRLFLRKRTNDHNSSNSSTSSGCVGKSVSFKFGCELTFFAANLLVCSEKFRRAWKCHACLVFPCKRPESVPSLLQCSYSSDSKLRISCSLCRSIVGYHNGSSRFSSSCCYRNDDMCRFSLRLS